MELSNEIQNRIDSWLTNAYDNETQKTIKSMLSRGEVAELADSFYRDLEFGTGGLRGIMGVGTNRMNIYTVGRATQGLCNYVLQQENKNDISVCGIAIGYDSRNNSHKFALESAEIISSNGINVYLYDDIKPIALLSYAVRTLGCAAGIVITASHNPKEYNGYKVYWNDGAQVIAPHDASIIKQVNSVSQLEIKKGNKSNIEMIGASIELRYIKELSTYVVNPKMIKRQSDIKIVYTPIHGSGYRVVPEALLSVGFNNVVSLADLQPPDGNFPTVKSPNPEDPDSLLLAIEKANKCGAELVMATDPDCDRMGCAIRTAKGQYKTLTGNQIGCLFAYYILSSRKENNTLPLNSYLVKTIVTSELAKSIADDFNIKIYDTLTGFKWIADTIATERDSHFIVGFEESLGYLINDNVRDKDAVSACVLMAEIAAHCKDINITLPDYLESIYDKYGYYYEETISLTKKGGDGSKEIVAIMENYRKNIPSSIAGVEVLKTRDYKQGLIFDKDGNKVTELGLPNSDVLQYLLDDNSKVTIRPSGTEPKIKFYFEVCVKAKRGERLKIAKERVNLLKGIIEGE